MKTLKASEIPVGTQSESSYRRGYGHGYWAAMQAILQIEEKGYKRPREIYGFMAEFWESELIFWKVDKSAHQPPELLVEKTWQQMVKKVKELHPNECELCGSTSDLEVDHIVSVYEFGTARLDNLRLLCSSCHLKRTVRDKWFRDATKKSIEKRLLQELVGAA